MGIISILLILVLLYSFTHLYLPSGRSATKLTVDDMATLSALLYEQDNTRPVSTSPSNGSATALSPPVAAKDNNKVPVKAAPKDKSDSLTPSPPSSQRPLTAQQRQRVYGYIIDTYPVDSTDSHTLKDWIGLFGQPGPLMNALKDHVFTVRSYFWLTGGGLYWEVIFWTWFGLIASLLFNVSESLRTPPHKLLQDELWTHIAKFFYAPLCSIAIFLGLSLAITDQKVLDQVNFSPNQILVAFILGFFSGRVIDLLQRIKNVILPDGTVITPATATPATLSPSTVGGFSPSLGLDDVETIIRQNGAFWQQAYPNVTGIAAQIKTTAGQPTGQASILFEVSRKLPNMSTGAIPPAFNVTMPDGRQIIIPTDVEEVGITRFNYTIGQPEIHLGIPTAVGSSVAAESHSDSWGTLGIRVRDSVNDYVLTCCHVVCGHLIKDSQFIDGKWVYDRQRDNSVNVMVPGGSANSQTLIGDVAMASFSSKEDFALIRLTDPTSVSSRLPNRNPGFIDYHKQFGAAVVNRTALMVGAFSNDQRARIVASYQEGEYQDIPGLDRPARMEGLVKTDLLSEKGDSGAAVYTQINNQKVVLGLLIANNTEASYILPISNYMIANGLTLVP